MKYLTLFCCLFFGVDSYSQSTKNSIKFLQEFFTERLPITYSDTVHQYDLKYLKEAIVKDTLYNDFFLRQDNAGRQLIITKDEKKYLLKKIDEQRGFVWRDHLLQNPQKNKLQENTSTSNFKKNFQSIYTFSKPIFIRNNSVCIFYYGYYCGGECGQGSVEISHKINGKWTRWISMVQWIS